MHVCLCMCVCVSCMYSLLFSSCLQCEASFILLYENKLLRPDWKHDQVLYIITYKWIVTYHRVVFHKAIRKWWRQENSINITKMDQIEIDDGKLFCIKQNKSAHMYWDIVTCAIMYILLFCSNISL